MNINLLVLEALFDPYGNVISDAGGKVDEKPKPSLILSPDEVSHEFKKIKQERATSPAKTAEVSTKPQPTTAPAEVKPSEPRQRQHVFGKKHEQPVTNNNSSSTPQSPNTSLSIKDKFKKWVGSHKVGVGAVGGGTAAAAGLAAYLHHRNKSHSLSGFAKSHGKHIAAGSLAALGATMGIKALLKRIKKKH